MRSGTRAVLPVHASAGPGRRLVALACALASALSAGCGSSASGDEPSDSPAQDAATEGSIDAAPDGAPTDAGTDHSSAEASPDGASTDAVADQSASDSPSDGGAADTPPDAVDGAQDAGQYTVPDRLVCPSSWQGHTTIPITDGPELKEASGIVASLRNDDLLWLHNDSGDTAQLFAVNTNGSTLGRVALDGVTAVDWEDIAAGPCPDHSGPCLWIADTGNASVGRDVLTLYVIPEPDASALTSGDITVTVPWKLDFRYPADTVDSEGMVLTPDGSAVYLFEKVDAPQARVFRFDGPFDPSVIATVEQVATISTPGTGVPKGKMITAADLHPSGTRLLLRVYTGIYEYRFGAGQGVDDIAQVGAKQAVLGPFDEIQGEAVAYDATGVGLWSISEAATLGFVQPLHHYNCKDTGVAP